MVSLLTFYINKFGGNKFQLRIFFKGRKLLVINYRDTRGEYQSLDYLNILNNLFINNNIINFKEIFIYDEDYNNHICKMWVYEWYTTYYYIDFSEYNFTYLKTIYLEEMRYSHTNPINKLNAPNIEKMIMHSCHIDNNFFDFIDDMPNLQHLFAHDSYIINNIGEIFKKMKNLKILFVQNVLGNTDKIIDDNSFKEFKTIENLILYGCGVASMKPFEYMPSLKHLVISDYRKDIIDENSIRNFAKYLFTNSSLETCYLY